MTPDCALCDATQLHAYHTILWSPAPDPLPLVDTILCNDCWRRWVLPILRGVG